ncbi:MAG: hypothetical protein ACRC20_05850 [Segniliparus sp.]|uniref:hypothetical protein n=1 Tax=Segniliparus sp. TaxID=2804064 RepID=UPI003F35FC6B
MTTSPSAPKHVMLRALIAGRTTVAITSLFVPRLGLRLLQIPGDGTPAPAMARLFGVRNALLAIGLSRLDAFKAPRAFLWANVVIDAVDALAFLEARSRREVGSAGAAIVTGIAASATVAGLVSALQAPADPAR